MLFASKHSIHCALIMCYHISRSLYSHIPVSLSHYISKKRVRHKICVTNAIKWDVDPGYIFFHLKRKGIQAHREGIRPTIHVADDRSAFRSSITLSLHKKGDNIVIMGSSPQHVVDTFCTFGLQIEEAETETKAEKVIVTTSQKSVTVVESTFQPFIFWILSLYRH